MPAVDRLPAIPLTGMMEVSRSSVKSESLGVMHREAWVSIPTGVWSNCPVVGGLDSVRTMPVMSDALTDSTIACKADESWRVGDS